ncbi:MAG: hypothetical protein EOP46_09750 [Sphingobacteriaceae bacterium]|nr:MAG: hypothetical protein EOP46_09750 [Sphingobacteriaceae bacterium]
MKLTELKSEFHALIDSIDDVNVIELFYDAMSQSVQPAGNNWKLLTNTQQQGVLTAYENSKNEDNLVPFSLIKEKFKEWPSK